MAQADPKQQRSLLAQILSGGGRGDPYINEASGPFANSPRIYGRADPYPAKAKLDPQSTGSIPVPQDRPDRGGGGGGGGGPQIPIPLSRPENPNTPNPLQAAVDAAPLTGPGPLSLWDRPNPLQAAVDAAPYRPYPSIHEDQPWGLPQPTPPHSILQHYPQIAEDQPYPWQPDRPHSNTPPPRPHRPYSPTPWARRATWG